MIFSLYLFVCIMLFLYILFLAMHSYNIGLGFGNCGTSSLVRDNLGALRVESGLSFLGGVNLVIKSFLPRRTLTELTCLK